METFRFTAKDLSLLEKFMKENNIKNKTEALRECIRRSVNKQDFESLFFDLNVKINKLIHNQFLIKKILEQFFVNMKFSKNSDVNNSETLNEINNKFDKYKNDFSN